MFEPGSKYWYKDTFISLGDESHKDYVQNHFEEMFPNIEKPELVGDNYALNNGYARLLVSKDFMISDILWCEFNDSFVNRQKLYTDILSNLNKQIKRMELDTPKIHRQITVSDFLSNPKIFSSRRNNMIKSGYAPYYNDSTISEKGKQAYEWLCDFVGKDLELGSHPWYGPCVYLNVNKMNITQDMLEEINNKMYEMDGYNSITADSGSWGYGDVYIVTFDQNRNIQSSRRIQSMKTPKNVYLNEDTQKLIQRLEKRVGHELKLKFEEGNTPYVEIEKLPKGGYSFITDKYLNNLAEHFLYDGYKEKQDSFIVYLDPAIMYTRPGIKSAYTREDYDRFDEYGEYIPYKPTEEELAKKDEIKTVLKQELSDAYEPDPMDDYAGYDSTNERMDSAVEKVANQFGVDTDFAWECANEVMNEENARQVEEIEWAEKNLKGDEYDKWYRGELDIRDRIHSSRQIKSALDTVKVTFDNGDTIVTDYNADVGREEIAKYYMHNYFNVGSEDEMHQVVKVEFPDNINSARVPEKADLDMAYQLEGYIESDHVMYDQFIVPVVKNLERKMKRGIFDYDKSLILWQHVADEGAKRYVKELGGPSYNVATRKEVAKNLAEYYKENYDVNGDIYNPIN